MRIIQQINHPINTFRCPVISSLKSSLQKKVLAIALIVFGCLAITCFYLYRRGRPIRATDFFKDKNDPKTKDEKIGAHNYEKEHLDSLLERVKEGGVPFSATINQGLIALGYTLKDQDKIFVERQVQLIAALEKMKGSETLSPNSLETTVFEITASLLVNKKTDQPLKANERQRLVEVFNAIWKFESSLEDLCKDYFSEKLENALKLLLDDSPKELIASYRIELKNMLEKKLMDLFLKLEPMQKLKGALWNLNEEQFNELTQEIHKEAKALKNRFFDLPVSQNMFDLFKKEIRKSQSKPYHDWLIDNKKNCLFSFYQGRWGANEVLGQGICKGITYQWCKEMQAYPDKEIHSEEDLGIIKGPSGVPDLASSRSFQVFYAASFYAGEIQSEDLPDRIKKKDMMSVKKIPISVKQNIMELINGIAKAEKDHEIDLSDSKGVVAVSSSNDTSGHCFLMRFNHAKGKYIFGDTNGGLWEYSTLEEMAKAFEGYLKATYSGKDGFNLFSASQYLFANPDRLLDEKYNLEMELCSHICKFCAAFSTC